MNPTHNNNSNNPWSFVPFALTIFTSAFLLFQVQPLISKQILPWFGGSPAVWTTAMLFFQSLLCLGYFYAHALASLTSRKTQARIHVVVLILAALLASRVLPGTDLPGFDYGVLAARAHGAPGLHQGGNAGGACGN